MEMHVYPVPDATKERTLIDEARYEEMYARSVDDNEGFWAEQAQRIDWMTPFTKTKDVSFAKDDLHIRWFEDGTLNACYNCVDRHLDSKGDDVAIIWEGDNPNRGLKITYSELHQRVCRFANEAPTTRWKSSSCQSTGRRRNSRCGKRLTRRTR